MKNKLFLILVFGVILRLFLAATTYHSDIVPYYFAGKVISEGNVFNFYDYLWNISPNNDIRQVFPPNLFNYPPVVYFFLGPLSIIFSFPFSQDLLKQFVLGSQNLFGRFDFNLLLLSLKSPFIIFDLALALLLYKFFDDPKEKLLAFGLWMLNPITLLATFAIGQFDVIPTFLSVLALYFIVRKNRPFLASFFLGLAASFKIFPFLFMIPTALTREKWTDRFKIVCVGLTTYIVTILPFIGSPGFRSTALVAEQNTKTLYAKIPISGGESIFLFPTIVIFIYLIFLFRRARLENLWQRFFIVLILFFIFTHYHPQWFLWLTPFMVIDLIKTKLFHWPLVFLSLFSFFALLTFFDPGLSTRLFSPIFPSLSNSQGIWQLLRVSPDINFARSILQTLFVSAGIYWIYCYFPKRQV